MKEELITNINKEKVKTSNMTYEERQLAELERQLNNCDLEKDDFLSKANIPSMPNQERNEWQLREKTEFESLIDDAYSMLGTNPLLADKEYTAKIVGIDYGISYKDNLTFTFEVYDDINQRTFKVYDNFNFSGQWKVYNSRRFVKMMSANNIDDFRIRNFKTIEDLTMSLKFLVGKECTLKTYRAINDTVKFFTYIEGFYSPPVNDWVKEYSY